MFDALFVCHTLQCFLTVSGQGLWCCVGYGTGYDGQVCAPVPFLLSGLFY